MPTGPGMRQLYGNTAQTTLQTTNINGGHLDFEIVTKSPTSRVRIQLNVTPGGSSGTGTDNVLGLIQTLKIFQGTQKVHSKDPDLVVTEKSVPYACLLTALRKKDVLTTANKVLLANVVSGNVIAYGLGDIYINKKANSLYISVDFEPCTNMGGYSTTPTSITINCAIWMVDDGVYGAEEEVISIGQKNAAALRIGDSNLPQNKTTVREIGLALSGIELSSVISQFQFDESLSSQAIQFLEDISAEKAIGLFTAASGGGASTGAGTKYFQQIEDPMNAQTSIPLFMIYKSAYDPCTFMVSFTAAEQIIYMMVA